MADHKIKRRRRIPQNPAFSTFARFLSNSNSRVLPSHNPPIGSKPIPKPEPEPKSKSKPKRVEPSPSSSSDVDDDEEEASTETIQADFGFFDPKPADFGGLKLLLQNYLDNKIWDLSGFVVLTLEQTTVGTVIKLNSDDKEEKGNDDKGDGDEDVYGVISALNLGRYDNKNATKHKVGVQCDCDEPIIYVKAEDEIFHELSSLSFTFRLHAEQLALCELKNYKVMD